MVRLKEYLHDCMCVVGLQLSGIDLLLLESDLHTDVSFPIARNTHLYKI